MADSDAGGIRPPATDGLVVAVIGSDGSGKSTLCAGLVDALALEGRAVRFVYFGSGDGASSWIRWPLVQARRLLGDRVRPSSAGSPAPTTIERESTTAPPGSPGSIRHTTDDGRSRPMRAARAVWAVTLSWEKRSKLRRTRRARRRGTIIVCDRWPQAQVPGRMDGPLLDTWARRTGGLRRLIGRWESAPYVDAAARPADVLLRLVVDQEHAVVRRPDHDPSDLARRRHIVLHLRFDESRCRIVDLDATRSADDVRRAALDAVRQLLPDRAAEPPT